MIRTKLSLLETKKVAILKVAMTFLVMMGAATPPVIADDSNPTEVSDGQVKALSGMSVLGNNEAPKSLVIVPWRSSELGDGLGIDNLLDERAKPVDKEVFKRELSYYRLRTTKTEQ
jgi:hypothetical protein